MNEETKQLWLRIGSVALITFIVSYLAFFVTLKHHLKNLNNPFYEAKKMEKFLIKQEQELNKLNDFNHPFEAKMRPMFINLVKENNEYKIIIDLNELDGNEDSINVSVQKNELTIRGELDKKNHSSEKIINFAQTYYLDEKVQTDLITKERKGNKYIITLPFVNIQEDEDED